MSADPIPELQRLGQRLEEARLARGLSQQEQAQLLRMGTEQLGALERGDRSQLPESVFVVAQARRVASSLGLNIDADIAALRGNPAFQSPPAGLKAPGAFSPPVAPAQRPRLPMIGLAGIVVLALAGGGVALLQHQSQPNERQASTTAEQPAIRTVQAMIPAASAPGPSGLLISTTQPSWLEVRNASGRVLFHGTLQGERRFPFSGELRLLAGRPDLVRVTPPGQPARVLGPIEAVRWRSFMPLTQQAPAP